MSLLGLFASVDCSTAIRRVSEVKRTRRRHQLPAGLPSKVEALSCHSAGVIPGQTSFANVRSRAVDRTRRRDADISNKGRAAIAVAPHSSLFVVDECERDPLDCRVILQWEPRPFAWEGAACTAGLARGGIKRCGVYR